MEAQIHAVEAEVARIEGLFADPEFFRKNAAKVNDLTHELDTAKEKCHAALFSLGGVGGDPGGFDGCKGWLMRYALSSA